MPERNSSEAPPPVETWLILSVTPADLMAFSESPPPTTEVAPDSATALARATVPRSKGFFSKIPMGPFQITDIGRLDGLLGIAAAYYGGGPGLGHGFGQGDGAPVEGLLLEDPHGTVPDHRYRQT